MKRRRQEMMPSIRVCRSAGYNIEKGIPPSSSSSSTSRRMKGPYPAKQVTITTTSNRLPPVIIFLLIIILCHDGCLAFLRVIQPYGTHNFHSKLHTISLLRWKQTKRRAEVGTVLLLYSPDNDHDKPVDRQGLSMSMRDDDDDNTNNLRPIPAMPSDLFQQLALSQLELLANSLTLENTNAKHSNSQSTSKIKSMALYLPQENVQTGQLEFLPAVVYPHPTSERVFIASDAQSGFAPTLPKLLTQLPGFAAPNSLLPRYPMVSTSGKEAMAGVGVVEEVLCDVRSGAPALSVPLFLGSQTVGVLLVSPSVPIATKRKRESDPNIATTTTNKQKRNNNNHPIWTKEDRQQIARAAQTLSMALSMDMERNSLKLQNQRVRAELSDSLHQVKNPLQALRTFGKLLQRRVADGDSASNSAGVGTTLQLLELTENLMAQSDRVINLLAPIDSIVDSLERPQLYLNPAPDLEEPSIADNQSLVPWDQANPPSLPWETDTLEFARREVSSSKEDDESAEFDDNSSTIKFTHRPRRQSFDTERQAIQRTTKESVDESNLPTMPWETETLEFARREAARRRKPGLVAPDETSVPVDGNNSTIEFSRKTTQQTTSTKQQEIRELAAQPVKTAASSSQAYSIVGDGDELEMGFVLDMLDPILKAFAAIGEERGIDFQVLGLDQADDLPGVFMRKKSLQEAVSNVIENAFKYVVVSPNGQGRNQNPLVRFHLLANESQDKNELLGVTLVVEDNGPGVNPEEAESIFQRGFRSPATSSAVDGTGIGLGISRMLLESMGGTLECLVKNTDLDLSTKRLSGGCFRLCLFRKR